MLRVWLKPVDEKGGGSLVMLDENLIKEKIRERLYHLGKSNPRKAVSGYLFSPRVLAEVRRQVIVELSGQVVSPQPVSNWVIASDIRSYRKRLSICDIEKFGIPFEEYLRLVKLQKNCCAICFTSAIFERTRGRPRLSIDHDHTTGLVRGLLCMRCNIRLGMNIPKTPKEFHYLANSVAVLLLGKRYYGPTA